MTDFATASVGEVPTFSECVVGYRVWRIDEQDRLWPISDHRTAWQPGINTARCNCEVHGALAFDWTWRDGRRVLEPHPDHPAPSQDCVCGLYSWRRPQRRWRQDDQLISAARVCGAVASWGRLQVHDAGFRAEHACVVTLAYPPEVSAADMEKLQRVAAAYRAELVALDQLEEAASRHGSPLPDSLRPDNTPTAPVASPSSHPDEQIDRAASAARFTAPPGLEPIPVRDRIALTLMFVNLCLVMCGSRMWFGHGTVAWIGLWMVAGGSFGWLLTACVLGPHTAAKHAGHHIRHHARRAAAQTRMRRESMTEAEFEAIEDSWDPSEKDHHRTGRGT